MWYGRCISFCLYLVTLVFCGHTAAALTAVPSGDAVVKTDSPLIVTNFSVTASRLNYIQIYNNSSEVQTLEDWRVGYTIGTSTIELPVELSGLVAPKKYIIIADQALGLGSPFEYRTEASTETQKITSVYLTPPASQPYLQHTVTTPTTPVNSLATYYFQRNISTSTDNYLSTFTSSTSAPTTLFMDPLYEYKPQLDLQFVEIVANAKNCSPIDTALECQDYIKLFNPTTEPIDLAGTRLRNGYLGQTPTASNTTYLSGVIEPGRYAVYPVNVTNSGGWLWFEDEFGMYRYDNTVTEYPDVSSESKKGQAWAYDETDGQWKWTTLLTPSDEPSRFPEPVIAAPKPTSSLVPCKENQYRSEETNRCRNLPKEPELTPCKEGQYRSEETNRCRSVVSAVAALVPCRAGQERNPATNRCRNIAAAASKTLKPCKEGQERNPETNRCRNVTKSVPAAAFAVEPIKESGKAFVGWWALGGIGILAAGYGAWEWRHEVAGVLQRVVAALSKQK